MAGEHPEFSGTKQAARERNKKLRALLLSRFSHRVVRC
jgi:hypothetical protein